MVLRGTRAAMGDDGGSSGCVVEVRCDNCGVGDRDGVGIATSVAGSSGGVAGRGRKRKQVGRAGGWERVVCDVCRKGIGYGGVRVNAGDAAGRAGSASADGDEEEGGGGSGEVSIEVVCAGCREKYAFCTECGGGGKHRTGKYRPIELFTPGRRTCGLSHVRFGDAPVSYRLHEVAMSANALITPDLLTEMRAVLSDGSTSLLANPRSMEAEHSACRDMDAVRAAVDDAWREVERDLGISPSSDTTQHRSYLALAYIPRIPRKRTRASTLRAGGPASPQPDLGGETDPPPSATDHVLVAFLTGSIDASTGNLRVGQFGARMMAAQGVHLARDLAGRMVGRARKDGGGAVEHLVVEV
ncbi:hypothetical protein HK101_011969, partial [Irineochytrium annulatum]